MVVVDWADFNGKDTGMLEGMFSTSDLDVVIEKLFDGCVVEPYRDVDRTQFPHVELWRFKGVTVTFGGLWFQHHQYIDPNPREWRKQKWGYMDVLALKDVANKWLCWPYRRPI